MSSCIRNAVFLLSLPLVSACEGLEKTLGDLLHNFGDFNGIAQVVPPDGSADVPLTSPVVIFSDNIYSNVEFHAMANGSEDLTSELRVETLRSGADKDIYVITRADEWPVNSEVQITLSGDIEREVTFSTIPTVPVLSSPTDFSFDTATSITLPVGWRGFGDYGALTSKGSMSPSSGSRLLVMSTGDAVDDGAVDDTSTLVVGDPMSSDGIDELLFDYRFQSSEFDDYCDSAFDDTMLVIASGDEDAIAQVVDSVNLICDDGRQNNGSFPGMPDMGDSEYRETAMTQDLVDISNVGSSVSISFVVTDVGDGILTTVVGVDSIELN